MTVLAATGKSGGRSATLRICGESERVTQGNLKGFLKVLGGSAICHFGQPEIVDLLSRACHASRLLPIDNPVHDLQPVAEAALQRRGIQAPEITLSELSARHGVPRGLSRDALTCPDAAITVMARVFRAVFLPEIAAPQGSRPKSQHSRSGFLLAPDDICALADGPDPAPALPPLAPPAGCGWRRGSWSVEEALDCAMRFRNGASLASLARLTRRSPRAIRARLRLDGIVA